MTTINLEAKAKCKKELEILSTYNGCMGFCNEYYTEYSVYVTKTKEGTLHEIKYEYKQNLSIDFNKAVEKMNIKYKKYFIDKTLKSNESLVQKVNEFFEDFEFSFGKLKGTDIRKCDDIWQLNRAFKSEYLEIRKNFAKNRLFELDYTYYDESSEKYTKQPEESKEIIKKISPYKDKQKVNLELQLIRTNNCNSKFGPIYYSTFKDKEGIEITYKGSKCLKYDLLSKLQNNESTFLFKQFEFLWDKEGNWIDLSEYSDKQIDLFFEMIKNNYGINFHTSNNLNNLFQFLINKMFDSGVKISGIIKKVDEKDFIQRPLFN